MSAGLCSRRGDDAAEDRAGSSGSRISKRSIVRRASTFGGAAVWAVWAALLVALPGGVSGGCFTATSTPLQGLCTNTYNVKVCASNQTQADNYVMLTHGVIVKANCKKALTILCGGVGGGEPNDNWEDVCCRTANQCETDADCEEQTDPEKVPLCCKYCMDVYADSCQSTQPVNAGFMSVGHLYDTFYSGDVRSMCKNSASSSGISQCVGAFDAMQRQPGNPCLGAPAQDATTASPPQPSNAIRSSTRSPYPLIAAFAVAAFSALVALR